MVTKFSETNYRFLVPEFCFALNINLKDRRNLMGKVANILFIHGINQASIDKSTKNILIADVVLR